MPWREIRYWSDHITKRAKGLLFMSVLPRPWLSVPADHVTRGAMTSLQHSWRHSSVSIVVVNVITMLNLIFSSSAHPAISYHTIPYHVFSLLPSLSLSLSLSAAWPAVELGQFKFEFVRIYSVQPSGVRYIHKQSTAFICVLAIYSMYTWNEVSNIRSDKFIRSCQYRVYRVYAARQLFNRDLH